LNKYTIVNEHGIVKGIIQCPSCHVKVNTPAGHTAVPSLPPNENMRWNGKAWKPLADRPTEFHDWDSRIKQWVDRRSPSEIKEHTRRSIKIQREANRNAFRWNGHVFQADSDSRHLINSISTYVSLTQSLPPTFAGHWRSSDNTHVPIQDVMDWKSFVGALIAHDINNYENARAMKQALETEEST